MAKQQQITTIITDDLTGEALQQEAAHTVRFALDGTHYEIDLSDKNATSLRADLSAWVNHARSVTRARASRSPRSNSSQATAGAREQNAAIREWARTQGHKISDRGRISATIVTAFNAAH